VSQVFDSWSGRVAHIEAAGSDSGEEAGRVIKSEQFAQAETGVEMVARAGGDEGFRDEGTLCLGDPSVGDGQGPGNGMDDNVADLDVGLEFDGKGSEGVRVWSGGLEPQNLSDRERFLFVQAEDDFEVGFELFDQFECLEDVLFGSFFGVGQIEEDDSSARGVGGAEFSEEIRPEFVHVRDHGPVDEADEVGGREFFDESVPAEAGLDGVPGDIVQLGGFGEHDLAVGELERVSMAGFSDAIDFGAGGEVIEDGMHVRVTEGAQVGDFDAEMSQRIGHDGSVSAEFDALVDEFDIGAVSGSRGDALTEFRDGVDAIEGVGRVSFVDDMSDFVDETVEPDEAVEAADLRGGAEQLSCAVFA